MNSIFFVHFFLLQKKVLIKLQKSFIKKVKRPPFCFWPVPKLLKLFILARKFNLRFTFKALSYFAIRCSHFVIARIKVTKQSPIHQFTSSPPHQLTLTSETAFTALSEKKSQEGNIRNCPPSFSSLQGTSRTSAWSFRFMISL